MPSKNSFGEKMILLLPFLKSVLNYFAGKQQVHMEHVLCGLYCAVAVIMLVFFGVEALLDGSKSYGTILLGFSMATLVGCGVVFYSGRLYYASHLVTVLMALLCLFLFYSGGADNTGVLWYFIFPSLVIFIQGIRTGLFSVVVLIVLTLLIYWSELFAFDPARYSGAAMQRIVAVYITVTVLTCLFAMSRNVAERELARTNARLEVVSATDSLTGLVNRRRMDELLADEARRFERFKSPFSVALMDIDHFKKVNDTYGHQFGDCVLQEIAKICQNSLREIDTTSRWGGEEFLILLPGASVSQARSVAERLRKDVSDFNFSFQGDAAQVSVSLGVAQYRQGITLDKCIRDADRCLYQAKAEGRNRIVDESQLPMSSEQMD